MVIVMGQHLGILLGEYLEIDSIDLEFVPAMGVNDLDTLNGIKERIEPLSLGSFIFLQLDQFVSETGMIYLVYNDSIRPFKYRR